MILRVCVWFSPLHAPISTDRMADVISMFGSISS